METDLIDLVDFPRETLEVEVKSWMDLDDKVARASIARHIAALCNHGGGYLVFGFLDDLTPDPNPPADLSAYGRDTISSIVLRYLTPAIECAVSFVKASSGVTYPVVRIPPHGVTPIAAKSDGPSDAKGRPQGIGAGVYYTRKVGPQSAPIIGADEWSQLIRRAVLADKAALLEQFAGLVQVPVPKASDLQRLAEWHARSEARFLDLLSRAEQLIWPVPIAQNRCQFSYLISTLDREILPTAELRSVLDAVNGEVRSTVWTGWSMFYPFTRSEIAPAFHPEADDGAGPDLLEANLMGDGAFDTSLPDFWRVSADGRASLIRPFREDRPRTVANLVRPAGTWLDPETIVRETTEAVIHARQMAARFSTAQSVAFRISWTGLRDRELAAFDPGIYWSAGRVARADARTVEGEWPLVALQSNWQEVVAELTSPVLRAFGFEDGGSGLVTKLAKGFIKL